MAPCSLLSRLQARKVIYTADGSGLHKKTLISQIKHATPIILISANYLNQPQL